jgi:hypothetical protein
MEPDRDRRAAHAEDGPKSPGRHDRMRDAQQVRRAGAHRELQPRGVPHLVRYVSGALDTLELLEGEDGELRGCVGVDDVRAQPDEWPVALNWGEGQELIAYAAQHLN